MNRNRYDERGPSLAGPLFDALYGLWIRATAWLARRGTHRGPR